MEMFFSAVLEDLVSRSMSFVAGKWRNQTTMEENLQRLHQVLLRIHTVVEEAEGRRIKNQGMLQQLNVLRDEMFKGYLVLDTLKYRILQEKDKDEEVSRLFALSKFNQAKRICFSTSNTQSMVCGSESVRELQQMLHSLENMTADMKEFIIFLTSYPPMHRQPYSTHLFLDKCMFSRHMERERIINFLLQIEPLGCENLGVLPIIGPARIGKSTLVEHVCNDERVQNHFSLILWYSGTDLKDETVTTLRTNCVIKHHNHAFHERLLLIIELYEVVDEETWRKLYSSARHGSKIIITSRSEKITSLGTTHALRLRCLPLEAYWYFFKMLVFGSTDPEEHPKLVSIATEIALELRGSFLQANVIGAMLRTNFNTQFWREVLTSIRAYMKKNLSSFGEYPDDLTHPVCAWRIGKPEPNRCFLLRESYQKGSAQDQVPEIRVQDLLFGSVKPRGKFEILLWKSQIPPYYNYTLSGMI